MNNSPCTPWKSDVKRWKVFALTTLGILASGFLALSCFAQDDTRSAPINTGAVFSTTSNSFDTSIFPATQANGFSRLNQSLSLSADGEIAGITWRARALFSEEEGKSLGRELRLKELNKVWEISDQCAISAGKRILAWDVGYLAQPVGFFQTQTVLTDIVDVAGNSEGLPLVMFSCGLGRALAVDVVRSDDLNGQDKLTSSDNRGLHQTVLRFSGQLGHATYAVLARQVRDQGHGFGATFSTTLGDELEIHASLYAHQGSESRVHSGLKDPQDKVFFSDPYMRNATSTYLSQGLIGATWTPQDFPTFTLEVTHNDKGLSETQWQRYRQLVRYHQTSKNPQFGAIVPSQSMGIREGNLLWDLKTISQQGTRRDYAYLQIQGSFAGFGYSLGNEFGLNDSSSANFISVRKDLSKHSYVVLAASHFSAKEGTEFSYFPIRNAVTLRFASSF